jgi:L-alanine-DL-glutamate epimerase-like enolase superfamily enzyme
MPDLQRAGGISEWLRIAALASASGVLVTPHVFHEIASHLLAAVPDAIWAEHVPWWHVLFKEPVLVTEGTIIPPERPGLGLEFDWDGLERHRVS